MARTSGAGERVRLETEVVRYRTPDGEPTCAVDFEAGEVCGYFRTQRMGVHETCLFAPEDYKGFGERLLRQGGSLPCGYLVPGSWCPLFAAGVTVKDDDDDTD